MYGIRFRYVQWRVVKYRGPDHAQSNTPESHRNLRDLMGPHDSLHVTASAYFLRLRPAADRACQPGNQRNRHSGAAHREHCPHPSIPNEILGEEERATLDPQAAPTNSKATERSRRLRRTFTIQLLTRQLLANTPTVATKRQHDFSIQGAVTA